ncbi:MAG: hypothetical protein WC417_00685 [Candidatus Omnitrophota bacterium]|jgi:RNA recognition motif-containing protein
MNIFVGNLPFDATEGDVKKLFEGFGNVASVVIVMEREKKAPKSRGFGFVEMPDEQQALAAIAALNGKEFMGRVLNVNPTRPKTEAQAVSSFRKDKQLKVKAEAQPEKTWFTPVFKPGTYKGGRRTRSYITKRGLAGIQVEEKPRKSFQDNPMRWRKKRNDQAKPWQKSAVAPHKPWEKSEEGIRPWKKAEGEFKPWHKPEAGARSWKKPEGNSKSWRKPEGDTKPWKKPEGDAKLWKRPTGEARPWHKSTGDAKPWRKSSERPQRSGFKPRKSPGGYKKRS